ncbi:MAG: glycoside hydrolase family 3 protein [Clostridia bacterium]|nr:glycoside hydrolase family 3 protein [Clostridia bacterium]
MNTKAGFDYLTGKLKYDIEKGKALSLQMAEEGIVLLENKNNALPLKKGEGYAFFGRMQKHYLPLGTGSGGRVVAIENTNVFDSLSALGGTPDKEVEAFYDNFVDQNPYDVGDDWIHPASQTEPELTDAFVASAAARNDVALVIFARTAGEDMDLKPVKGGFMLTDTEVANLKLIRKHFKKLVVLVNACGIIDFSEIVSASPDALLMLWTGGMMGGLAAARILLGEANPSGKLPDTIAQKREDYPAYENFNAPAQLLYKEDIYVGYRYFQTFAPNKVLYPFGYGLSYTEFGIFFIDIHRKDNQTLIRAVVSNLGTVAGSEVVQCYVTQPCGKLGKARKVLADFVKTPVIAPGESCTVSLSFSDYSISSYDDSGISGNKYAWVLEAGEYVVTVGSSSADNTESCSFTVNQDTVTKQLRSALAPVTPFERMVNKNGVAVYEPAPLRINSPENIPAEIPQKAKDGVTFADVADGKITMQDFVARLSDEDLICMVRAEGMSSPKVTPGTAAAFVGVTPSLQAMGLPALCCTDGPSGIRMETDIKCVSYPAATCQAASWNTALTEEIYNCCGSELASYHVDILLGPGTNIHRDPLCGRNFEYFSEDPYLSGKMAAAICRGLDSAGVSGAVKHFLCNNQELDRHGVNAVVSERAIREIYAKPFEICIAESPIRSVMTSYNPVNGRWAASNYDLTVRLLREDFGFTGFVMTDWWARVSGENGEASTTNLKGMVHAQNDVYMVSPDASTREDNLPQSLADGSLTRGELQQCAINLLNFTLDSLSYMALRQGYGKKDLKAECEGKAPVATVQVTDGKCIYNSPEARKAIIRVGFVSNTNVLTQTSISLIVSTKNAAGFIVGGTDGKVFTDYREIALRAGENEFIFNSGSPLANAVTIEIF